MLREWWNVISSDGLNYGYYPNDTKETLNPLVWMLLGGFLRVQILEWVVKIIVTCIHWLSRVQRGIY